MSNQPLNEYSGSSKIRTMIDLIDLLQNEGIKVDSNSGGGGITDDQMRQIVIDYFTDNDNYNIYQRIEQLILLFNNKIGNPDAQGVFSNLDGTDNNVLSLIEMLLRDNLKDGNLPYLLTIRDSFLGLNNSVFKNFSDQRSVFLGTDGESFFKGNSNSGVFKDNSGNSFLSQLLTNSINNSNNYFSKLTPNVENNIVNVPANTPIGAVSGAIDLNVGCKKIVIQTSSNLLGNLTLRSDNDILPSKIMNCKNMANDSFGSNMTANGMFQCNNFSNRILFSQNTININPYTITFSQWIN